MDGEDDYVGQLKEVFDDCDTSGEGLLSKANLVTLCDKLQVEDQSEALVKRLIGNSENKKVGFDEFKDGFVAVLSQCADLISTEDEVSAVNANAMDDAGDASPKFIHDGKKYGRRSRPEDRGADTPVDFADLSDIEMDDDPASNMPQGGRKHHTTPVNPVLASATPEFFDNDDGLPRDPLSGSEHRADHSTGDPSFADHSAADDKSEVDVLREIWEKQGVGKSGYLTFEELGLICENMEIYQNEEELGNLFEKLDADGDGKVSFDEFVRGLSQEGTSTTPRLHSSQNRKLKLTSSLNNLDSERRTQTPSILSAITGSGYFSYLDPDTTGYAQPEDIVEFWESFGIIQDDAICVLEMLDFEIDNQISLQELSSVLEQELLNMEMENAIYQVAIHSCRHELKHLKGSLETANEDKEKQKQDIDDVRRRNDDLLRESDERFMNQEKGYEAKLASTEQKYQDHLKVVQTQLNNERELLSSSAHAEKTKLELVISKMREEERRLKQEMSFNQTEMSNMDKELHAQIDKNVMLDKENERIKKELLVAIDMQNKVELQSLKILEEIEYQRNQMTDEQNRFSEQKIKDLEDENKVLRDHSDEMLMELEELKQTLAGRRKSTTEDGAGGRRGSLLSDYTAIADQSLERADLENEFVELEHEKAKAEALQQEVETLRLESEDLRLEAESLRHKIIRLQDETLTENAKTSRIHDTEKSDMLEAHRNDIQSLNQKHRQQVINLEGSIDKLKLELSSCDTEWKRKHEAEVRKVELTASRERMELVNKLQDEHREQVRSLRNDMGSSTDKEIDLLRAQYTQEKEIMESRFKQRIEEYETMLERGADSLKGRLRNDFDTLVDEQAQAEIEVARRNLEAEYEKEKDELYDILNKEKQSMEDQFNDRLYELENQIEDTEEDVRAQCEDEFMEQIQVVQQAFDEERAEYESQISQLKLKIADVGSRVNVGSAAEREVESFRRQRDDIAADRDQLILDKNKMMLERNSAQNQVEISRRDAERTESLLRKELDELRNSLAKSTDKKHGEELAARGEPAIPNERVSILGPTDHSVYGEERTQLLDEGTRLRRKLESAEEQIFKLTTDLQLAESQHERQVHDLKMRSNKMYDVDAYQKLEIKLQSEKKKCVELEEALRIRSSESNKLLLGGKSENDKQLSNLAFQRDEYKRKLVATRDSLSEVTQKLKEHLIKSTQTDQLVRELYAENANLMEALSVTEKRQKTAEWSKVKLIHQYESMSSEFKKLSPMLRKELL